MTDRVSIFDLLSQKGKGKWLQLHVDTAAEAAAAVEAGIVILSCEPDHTLEPIRRAAPGWRIAAHAQGGQAIIPDFF